MPRNVYLSWHCCQTCRCAVVNGNVVACSKAGVRLLVFVACCVPICARAVSAGGYTGVGKVAAADEDASEAAPHAREGGGSAAGAGSEVTVNSLAEELEACADAASGDGLSGLAGAACVELPSLASTTCAGDLSRDLRGLDDFLLPGLPDCLRLGDLFLLGLRFRLGERRRLRERRLLGDRLLRLGDLFLLADLRFLRSRSRRSRPLSLPYGERPSRCRPRSLSQSRRPLSASGDRLRSRSLRPRSLSRLLSR
mmetsp:Transcript_2138/g.4510  ORF Transcript_2138/g.4510 Transcript_2138/m.4510 type:complete len:253 (-) Transcript_2138:559-1317(-)